MLASAESFANDILTLMPTNNVVQDVTNFVIKVGNFCNQVQAGDTGMVGILTFGNQAMIDAILSMQPVSDNSWVEPFVDAFIDGLSTSIISAGTVMDIAWLGSGKLDAATLPIATVTLTTIPLSKASLTASLLSAVPTSGPPIQFANAIRNAMLQLVFLCVGLGVGPTFTPIPLPFNAE